MSAATLRFHDFSCRQLAAPAWPPLQWLAAVSIYLVAAQPTLRRAVLRQWVRMAGASAETRMIWSMLCFSSATFIYVMFGGGTS